MTEDGRPRTEDRGDRGKIRISKFETNSNDRNSKIRRQEPGVRRQRTDDGQGE